MGSSTTGTSPTPDNVALEITAASEMYSAALQMLRQNEMSVDEIRDCAAQLLGPELVIDR